MAHRPIQSFNQFNTQSYQLNQLKEEATDWWISLPQLLINMGKVVNLIKSSLIATELQDLRVIYAKLKTQYLEHQAQKNYASVKEEKNLLKEFLKILNEAQSRTHLFVGVNKTTPRGSYQNRWGGRWVTEYHLIYGKERDFSNAHF